METHDRIQGPLCVDDATGVIRKIRHDVDVRGDGSVTFEPHDEPIAKKPEPEKHEEQPQ